MRSRTESTAALAVRALWATTFLMTLPNHDCLFFNLGSSPYCSLAVFITVYTSSSSERLTDGLIVKYVDWNIEECEAHCQVERERCRYSYCTLHLPVALLMMNVATNERKALPIAERLVIVSTIKRRLVLPLAYYEPQLSQRQGDCVRCYGHRGL